jgi:hypothetical protein
VALHAEEANSQRDGLGDDPEPGSTHVGGGRWLTRLILACLVLGAVAAVALRPGNGPAHPGRRAPPPPVVITVGHPLLGVTAGWELFARGPGVLVAVRLARGQITETTMPSLQTGNPDVAFLVSSREAIVRSADYAPGYLVPAGSGARLLTGPLAGGGPLIPGPKPQQAWVLAGPPTRPSLSLVTLTGRPLGEFIRFPLGGPQLPATAVSDGRGYVLLLTSTYSIFDAGPTWERPVGDSVVAVGPTGWLIVACDPILRRCRGEVIDPVTGARRVLPGPSLSSPGQPSVGYVAWPPMGVISPDGSIAAVPLMLGSATAMTVHLISLRSGADTPVAVQLAGAAASQSLAWSPDSKWLFAAAAGGRLLAVDARTGQVRSLGLSLPYVTQVAVQDAPG